MIDWRFIVSKYSRKLLPRTEYVHALGWKWYNRGIADPTPEMFALECTFKREDVLQKGKVFLDIGANMGLWSVQASPYYESIIALEPNPEIYPILLKNIKINLCRNVNTYNVAVSDHTGHLRLYKYYNHAWTSALLSHNGQPASNRFWDIPCKRIDDLNLVPTTIKIDTEGHELPILQGATRTLEKHHPKLVLEIHRWEDHAQICRFLEEYGYNLRQPEPTHLVGE